MAGISFDVSGSDRGLRDTFKDAIDKSLKFEKAIIKAGEKLDSSFDAKNLREFGAQLESQRKTVAELEKQYQSVKKTLDTLGDDKQGKLFSDEDMKAGLDRYNKARKLVESAKKELDAESASLDKLEKGYNMVSGELGNLSAKQTTYMTQIRQLKNDLQELAMAGKSETDEYRAKVAELERVGTAYNKVNKEAQLLTKAGSATLSGMAQGITGIAGAFSAGQGVMSLFVKDNEKLAAIQTKLQAAMAITIGLQQVSNTLHSTSSFRIGIVNKATSAWTRAQSILNTQLGISVGLSKALMFGVVGLVAAGVTAAIMAYSKWNEKQKEANRLQQEFKDVEKEVAVSMAKSKIEINDLIRVASNYETSLDLRKEAVKKLNELMPDYNGYIDEEGRLIGNTDEALKKYLATLYKVEKAKKLTADKIKYEEEKKSLEIQGADDVSGFTKVRYGLNKMLGFSGDANQILNNAINQKEKEHQDQISKLQESFDKADKDLVDLLNDDSVVEKLLGGLKQKDSKTPVGKKDNRISIEERINSELIKLRQQNIQDSINLEKTGLEKELALIEHNANIKLEKIKEQEKAWKDAQGGDLTNEQTIEINTAYKNVGEEAKQAADKANKDFIDAEKKKNDDILKEFQSYQDKYLAEQAKFEKKRKDLESIRTKDNSPQVDRSLEELKFQEDESLNAINEEFAQREETYQAWLNEITNLSLEQLVSALEQAKAKLKEVERSGSDQDVATTRAKITQLGGAISKVQNGITPGKRTIKEWGDLHRVLTTVKRSFDEIGDSIGGVAGDAIKTAGEVTASTIMMIDGIVTLSQSSAVSIEGVSKAAAKAIQAVEKASVILAIISAALQITMKIFDLLGGDNTTEKYEKAKEAYESYISILDKVIQKQLELAESLTGENARAAYQQAIDLIKEQSEAARVLGKQYLNSGASWKSRSKGYTEVKDMSAEGWADAAKALGMSIEQFKNLMGGRMDGLFDLTDSQLKELAENAHIFWSQLDDDTAKFANQIVDGIKEAAEVIEQKIFDTTLLDKDTLRNDFADMLSDMTLDAKDFAEQFEKYLQNAIINSMMKEEFNDRLSDWRKKMSAFFANDGKLSDEEYRELKEDAEKIATDMKDQQKILADMFDWSAENDPSKENSLRGAFGRASNESIELLAGQTNAYRVELKNIGVDVASMLDILRSQSPEGLNILSGSIKSSMDSIGMIMQNGFNEFRIMREVTQELRQLKIESNRMAERIEQYNERIADNTSKIADSSNRAAKTLDSGTIRVNPTGGGMR